MNEKRYFKIFCKQHILGSQNKYVALFDIISSLENYDEVAVKKKLSEKQFASTYFSSDINYLTQILFKALNDFHSDKTSNLKIKQSLVTIEILFYKGLYEECLNLINKTKRIKLSEENQYLILELLNWEKKCLGYSKGLQAALEVNNKLDNYFDAIRNYKVITDLYYQSYFLKNSVGEISQEVVEDKFNVVLSKMPQILDNATTTIHAKIFYNLIYSNYYHVKKEHEKDLEYLRKVIEIFDANEVYKQENPLDYISVFNRIIDINKKNNSVIFYADLATLRSFEKMISLQYDVARERIFIHTYQAELEHLLGCNKLDEAILIMDKILKTVAEKKYNIEPYYMMALYYLFAVIYCAKGDFSAGLKYVNKVLNEYKLKDRPKVFIKTEFLNGVIHYELKNYSLAAKHIMSLDRKYKSNFKFSFIEKSILKALLKIIENPLVKSERIVFGKAKQKIQKKYKGDSQRFSQNHLMRYVTMKAV